jgi:tRNA U34 5-methylaminomethyl-2-thiouridine-forming methyltransferase MnmC
VDKNQHKIIWQDGVPVSERYGDPFYSLKGGLEETRYVFLKGNDLPARFCDGFHVAELGFGTGLNFLATLQAFRDAGVSGKLRYTSFENAPMAMDDMKRALEPFPELPRDVLLGDRVEPDFELTIIQGDVRNTLSNTQIRANAWYLDGFSPALNPEIWEDAVLQAVAAKTASGGTFATYTAVGRIRRSLAAAGFEVERIKGFNRKPHMTKGHMP